MGAPIGYFSDDQPRDYPELNKCPDCETFFQTPCCPLCGKECPEEFRAGNRKPVKQKKPPRRSGNGRVRFVPWYHSAWFIILMLIVMPIVGVILLWQSDYAKGWKIGGTVAAVGRYAVPWLISIVITAFGGLFPWQQNDFPKMPQEEYMASCEEVDPEAFYRQPTAYYDKAVKLTATVVAKRVDEAVSEDIYDLEYIVYYECTVTDGTRDYVFLIRDARKDNFNLLSGDSIVIYGRAIGNAEIYNTVSGKLSAPCVVMYYVELVR